MGAWSQRVGAPGAAWGGWGTVRAGLAAEVGGAGRLGAPGAGPGRSYSGIRSEGPDKRRGLGGVKGRDRELQAPGLVCGAHRSPWRRVSRLGECFCFHLSVGVVYESLWVRGCHVGVPWAGGVSARMQRVRHPDCTPVEWTTLRVCVLQRVLGGWGSALPAELPRGSSGGSLQSACAQAVLFVLPLLPDSFPSPSLPIPRLERAGSPPPLLGARPRPPPPFLRHKVYLQQKGARSRQPRGRKREPERQREGRQAGRLAGGHRAEERSAGIQPVSGRAAMLRVAPGEAGARPGSRL